MTRLEYFLREGLIEIVYGEKNYLKNSRRMKVYLNNLRFAVKLVKTNMGLALHHLDTGDVLVLDMAVVEKYGVPEDAIEGLTAEVLESAFTDATK